jgi:hypothetical protein
VLTKISGESPAEQAAFIINCAALSSDIGKHATTKSAHKRRIAL